MMEQYKMPRPTAASRAGIAAFPKMIPGNDRHPNAAYISEIDSVLRTWDVPVLVMFSAGTSPSNLLKDSASPTWSTTDDFT